MSLADLRYNFVHQKQPSAYGRPCSLGPEAPQSASQETSTKVVKDTLKEIKTSLNRPPHEKRLAKPKRRISTYV